jgi:murein DD-endopeptidase MepM/ murein hydrolase activator NlpD
VSNSTYKNNSTNTLKKENTIPSKQINVNIKNAESSMSVLFGEKNYTELQPFFEKNGLIRVTKSEKSESFIKKVSFKDLFKRGNSKLNTAKVILAGVFAVGTMFQPNTQAGMAEAKVPSRSTKKSTKKTISKTSKKAVTSTASRAINLEKGLNRNGSRDRVRLTHRGLSVSKDSKGLIHSGRIIMPAVGEYSSGFGPRWGKFHKGMDIAAAVGTPINAAMTGNVSFTGWQSGYGEVVEITHPNGLVTRYAHCSKINVKKGQAVDAGENIANMGMTGHVTGPHVHFEVLAHGVQVNPKNYM